MSMKTTLSEHDGIRKKLDGSDIENLEDALNEEVSWMDSNDDASKE